MSQLVKSGLSYFVNDKCIHGYVDDFDFLNVICFKQLLSKCLGYGIIAGSLLVKVPQVKKLLNNKSGEGINLISVLLDLTAITSHMSYNYVKGYPFSAWGDSTFLAFQTAIIAALVLYYGGKKAVSFLFCIVYALIVYVLHGGFTPINVLMVAQGFNIPILLLGKLSQAWTNYKNSSTGQLSAATVFLLFAGSLARIFTSAQETGDLMIILTFCFSTFANGVIAAQMLYYWNKPAKGRKDKGGKPTTKADGAAKKTRSKKID
ncbi:PREDICTED: mannose-P-dolichol utilization defect 1 protein homolog [Rhagoletis zephyria]|uniref:mannose-P-dolichol utilization defect 1 protein homolog n=1 Tax=Rhagoletis zephyria TaxID=28612 RepID=UPI0008113A65|nr:PREDICTED: mannose-P-dolichol utilization defect 1 protein homolog [Rhagoletis zephyria]